MSQSFCKPSDSSRVLTVLLLGFLMMITGTEALAQAAPTTGGGFAGACDNVVTFFQNFETILKAASVTIVTIAIVFAGYQIAFAHKRLSDVAPVLIGGLLIGGAAAIAGWFTASWAGTTTC
ncbi:TrbC/VirB2 family protein [Hydrogenophaga flava]|uniref:TrbC/VirB2 family protein n=1 Tax=Hydrogenophaga flava TaxID=65657 RepID=UPI000825F64A|nr:TrbC/VirB2 family protein [Hydrogenophaga flava]